MTHIGLLSRLMMLVLLAGLPASLIILHDHSEMRRMAEEHIWEQVRTSEGLIEAEQARFIDSVRRQMQALAQAEVLRSGDTAGCQAFLRQMAPSLRPGDILHAADLAGRVICSTEPSEIGVDISGRSHFIAALAGQEFTIGTFIRRQFDDRPSLPFAMPFYDHGGKLAGAVTMPMDLTSFDAIIARNDLPPDTSVVLADRNGTILARFPDSVRWAGRSLPESYRALSMAGSRGVMEAAGVDGRERIVAYSPRSSGIEGLFLAVGYDKEVVLAPLQRMSGHSRILIAVSLTGALLAAWVFYLVAIRRPVRALTQAATDWRSGRFAARAPTRSGPSDLAQLALAFNSMAAELERREAARFETMRQLERTQARHRAVVDTAVDAMIVIDELGHVRHFNRAAEQIFGYPAEEVLGRNVSMLMPEPDRSGHDGYLRNYKQTGKAKIIGIGREVRGRRKDGSEVPLELSIAKWQEGCQTFFTGIMRDITTRKAVDEALRETADRLRLALKGAHAGLWDLDIQRNEITWSGESFELFGIEGHGPLVPRSAWLTTMHPDDLQRAQATFEEVCRSEREDYYCEFRINHPTKGLRWLAGIGRMRYGEDGTPLRASGLNIDITDLKTAEQAAQAAQAEAERANQSKSRFLAAASHDLRQPVQALVLMMTTLAHKLDGHSAAPVLDGMRMALDALQMLLEALLDVSRLDAGVVVAKPVPVDLGALLERLGQEYGMRAQARGLSFRVRPCDLHVLTDPALLERILRNLLENALRYTDRGGVLVGGLVQGDVVQLRVTDTGVGIPRDQQQAIFQEFYQVDNPERDRGKGLGLGLSIVRRLADLMHHELKVRSRPGLGSRFTLALPQADMAQPANTDEAEAPSCPGIIMVIDDEEIVREGLRLVLEDWGCAGVVAFEDAAQAVAWVHEQGRAPAAIIADYRLRGGRTGVNAVHEVQLACGHPIPAVIITGDTAPARIAEVQHSGFAIAHKPVQVGRLKKIVAGLREVG